MRFWKTPDEKILPEAEKAWLMRVCRNMAIDTVRRSGKITAVGGSTEIDVLMHSGKNQTYPNDNNHSGNSALGNDLEVALGALPKDQQEVVRLRFQHDLSYKDISDVTGHSVSNVGVVLHEAMKKLKTALSQASASTGGPS